MYHPTVYDSSTTVPSLWEATVERGDRGWRPLASDASCEVAIIGGGYTGLSAALHLARDHGIGARVLEAGPIAWGASGRNGGFCTYPATKLSPAQLVRRYGEDESRRFMRAQVDAVELVRTLIADEGIACDVCGEGEIEVAHKPEALPGMHAYGADLARLSGVPVESWSAEAFREVGFDSTEQFGAICVRPGFGLHPLKLALGIAEAAARRGARLHPESRVEAWERDGSRHVLHTSGGRLRAEKVILATNGFTPEHLNPAFAGRPMPVLSNIVVTRPLTDAELAAQSWWTSTPCISARQLFFYFRVLPDQRFLFGARGDASGSPEGEEGIRRWLVRRLGEVFPAWRDVPITHVWRGLICMTRRFTPAIGSVDGDPTVHFAFGYHGSGVASANWAGMMAARLAVAKATTKDLPAPLAGLPPRIPLPGLRPLYLRAALLGYRVLDLWR